MGCLSGLKGAFQVTKWEPFESVCVIFVAVEDSRESLPFARGIHIFHLLAGQCLNFLLTILALMHCSISRFRLGAHGSSKWAQLGTRGRRNGLSWAPVDVHFDRSWRPLVSWASGVGPGPPPRQLLGGFGVPFGVILEVWQVYLQNIYIFYARDILSLLLLFSIIIFIIKYII